MYCCAPSGADAFYEPDWRSGKAVRAPELTVLIRLGDIDATEKRQPFGTRSKESLSDMVFNRVITVQTKKTDRYGRAIGKVLVDGIDANLQQVRPGSTVQPPPPLKLSMKSTISAEKN